MCDILLKSATLLFKLLSQNSLFFTKSEYANPVPLENVLHLIRIPVVQIRSVVELKIRVFTLSLYKYQNLHVDRITS